MEASASIVCVMTLFRNRALRFQKCTVFMQAAAAAAPAEVPAALLEHKMLLGKKLVYQTKMYAQSGSQFI